MTNEISKKITETAAKTAGLLRRVSAMVAGVRTIAVEIDPGAADVPADELPAIIGAGLADKLADVDERLTAIESGGGSAIRAIYGQDFSDDFNKDFNN